MIQIQNDNINPTAVVSKPVSDPNSNLQDFLAAASNSISTATPASASDTTISAPTESSADIDQLLADLDKLSRELDEKGGHNSGEEAPISPSVVPDPPAEDSQVKSVEENKVKTDEEFDFDAFLSDLEKKIDKETEKKDVESSTEDGTEDSFRQNRVAPNLEENEEKVIESTNPVADNSKTTPEADLNQEDLKSQNIFDMLGLTNISNEEKDGFLDELEEMIWSDFTTHDLQLILTAEEYTGAKAILDKSGDETQRKEDLIVYLDKLIPDLDEVLYEKALELKSEMVGERLKKLKSKGANLEEIKEAEDLISQNRWKSAVSLLNQLS